MTIICGQCSNASLSELALEANYATNCDDGNIINFLHRLEVICYESNNGGLSHKPYKIAVTVKVLHNYTNLKPSDPRGFKEELKVKYKATLAVIGTFPNKTRVMERLLKRIVDKTGIITVG